MVRLLARVAFTLSGVAGLTFEIVWLRHLGLAVGTTTLAVATTTAAYMGGLALGSYLGGQIADRLRRPLSVYGGLELGLAVVGLAVPAGCALVPHVDAALFPEPTGGATRALVRFVAAIAVLILPTTAMGMTLPVLARAVTQSLHRVGREVGVLYALNIGGAMVGAAVAGFVLIPNIGLSATNQVAVGIDATLGTLALVAGLLAPAHPAVATRPGAAAPILRPGRRSLVAMLAVTGASAMVLQVLWTRALGTALGPSTYAFTAIVCAYLVGLAAGGGLAAWLSDRVVAVRSALLAVLVLTGAATLFGIFIVDDLPLLLHGVVLDKQLTMGGLMRTEFALAAFSVVPATIGMGAIFPVTLTAVVGAQATLGAAVGRAYAVNTLGNIAGSFAGVFVLLPLFGIEWGMRVAALAYLLLALWLSLGAQESALGRWRHIAFGMSVALIAVALAWPSWKISNWTAGLFRMSLARHHYESGDFRAPPLIFHRDGMSTTVTVEEEGGARWMKVNGKIDGSSEGDMPTQVLSGILPLLFHENPKKLAVIGCGSGVTAGSTLAVDPESVTLVELEGTVLEAAKLFEEVNHAPWADPRVTVVEDDGRNYLRRERRRFDVIISEPSNPWMTGAASLFTVEFFRIARERLESNGIFLQWLQIYELAPERIGSMLRTFAAVFPHVLVFSAHTESNDLLLLGSGEPVRIDWQTLEARFESMAAELQRAELDRPQELLALLLFTNEQIASLPPELPLNTDDNALIEFGAPRDLLYFAETDPKLPLLEQTTGRRARIVRRLLVDVEPWSERIATLAQGYLRQGMLPDALAAAESVRNAEAASLAARSKAAAVGELAALFEEDDLEIAVDAGVAQADSEYRRLARLVQHGEEESALGLLNTMQDLDERNGAYALLYGFLAYRDGEYVTSRRALLRARQDESMRAHEPAITYYLAKAAFDSGRYSNAVDEMIRYRETSQSLSRSHQAD